jgi:hypothetical protein
MSQIQIFELVEALEPGKKAKALLLKWNGTSYTTRDAKTDPRLQLRRHPRRRRRPRLLHSGKLGPLGGGRRSRQRAIAGQLIRPNPYRPCLPALGAQVAAIWLGLPPKALANADSKAVPCCKAATSAM